MLFEYDGQDGESTSNDMRGSLPDPGSFPTFAFRDNVLEVAGGLLMKIDPRFSRVLPRGTRFHTYWRARAEEPRVGSASSVALARVRQLCPSCRCCHSPPRTQHGGKKVWCCVPGRSHPARRYNTVAAGRRTTGAVVWAWGQLRRQALTLLIIALDHVLHSKDLLVGTRTNRPAPGAVKYCSRYISPRARRAMTARDGRTDARKAAGGE